MDWLILFAVVVAILLAGMTYRGGSNKHKDDQ
jgi:hypothetical protein